MMRGQATRPSQEFVQSILVRSGARDVSSDHLIRLYDRKESNWAGHNPTAGAVATAAISIVMWRT
jgi:hypothetical protein